MQRVALFLVGLALAGCQNVDSLKPSGEATAESEERAFTRVGIADPGPLTSEVARDWFDRVREVEGQARLDRIEEFWEAFPETRRLPVVHQMQADAFASQRRLGEAADAYERALVLTRTDITGLPLSTELPMQLALTRLSSGDVELGVEWLLRVSIADRGERVDEGLRWAFGTHFGGGANFEAWRRSLFVAIAPRPPAFQLPGLLQEQVSLEPGAAVTLVNFWSPT